MRPHPPLVWIVPNVIPYSLRRRWMADAFGPVHQTKMIHCLFEADVSGSDAALRAHYAKTGESLSMTTFLTGCLAKAVSEYKALQSYRLGGKALDVFDDADIYMVLERHDEAGQKHIIPYTIRAAHCETLRDLHREMPSLFAFVGIIGRRYPHLWRMTAGMPGTTAGTPGTSELERSGNPAGCDIALSTPTRLMKAAVDVGERWQVPADDRTTVRVYLCQTISRDHDASDVATAARFTERLKELIERGHGLDESQCRVYYVGRSSAAAVIR
jgi:hypothetical protein